MDKAIEHQTGIPSSIHQTINNKLALNLLGNYRGATVKSLAPVVSFSDNVLVIRMGLRQVKCALLNRFVRVVNLGGHNLSIGVEAESVSAIDGVLDEYLMRLDISSAIKDSAMVGSRTYERVEPSPPYPVVTAVFGGVTINAQILDISWGGLSFLVNEKDGSMFDLIKLINKKFVVRFRIPSTRKTEPLSIERSLAEGFGNIVYVNQQDKTHCKVGARVVYGKSKTFVQEYVTFRYKEILEELDKTPLIL